MRVIELRFLRGPNRFARRPCLMALVELDAAGPDLSELRALLTASLPTGLVSSMPAEFLSVVHLAAWTAQALQRAAGNAVGFWTARQEQDMLCRYRLAYGYSIEAVAEAALEYALACIQTMIHAQQFNMEGAVQALRVLTARHAVDAGSQAIARAALRRRIPVIRQPDKANLYQLGWGCLQQSLQAAADTDASDSSVACHEDWRAARKLLLQARLPVPAGGVASSTEEAWRIALGIGLPVLLRPAVQTKLDASPEHTADSQDAVSNVFTTLNRAGDGVIIEQRIAGQRFRMLVAGGRVMLTVAWPALPGNLADLTSRLAPHNHDICARAAQCLDLKIAVIDLICGDLAAPLSCQHGTLVGVYAASAVQLEQLAASGLARCVAEAILDGLFEPHNKGRIPVIAVAGTNGKTTTTRMIAHALRLAGLHIGVATSEGIDIGLHRVDEGDCTGYWSARMVLTAPQVQAAVLETARGGLLKRGLGFDRCDVAVMLNVSADHLGQDGVHSVSEMARVKSVVVRCARRAVVLNAQDEYCVAMAHGLPRQVEVMYFSMNAEEPVLLGHLARGGRAVYLKHSRLMLAEHDQHIALLDITMMPAALQGHARHNIANGLAAAAALIAAGYPTELAVAALSTFVSDASGNPLRANLFEVQGVTVLVDYAHNSVACTSLAQMARSICSGVLRAVVTVPGDRRDCDLFDIGRACGAGFDELVVYEADPRGRSPGETARHLLAGAASAGQQVPRWMHMELDIRQALALALARCKAGDMLVFTCGSSLDELVAVVCGIDPASAERIKHARA